MQKEEFYAYTREIIGKCFDIMHKADEEYATPGDKFANFKAQALMENRTPEQVAITFLLKHVRSLVNGVSLREPMEGRICDIINYVLLIAGMREEASRSQTSAVAGKKVIVGPLETGLLPYPALDKN